MTENFQDKQDFSFRHFLEDIFSSSTDRNDILYKRYCMWHVKKLIFALLFSILDNTATTAKE